MTHKSFRSLLLCFVSLTQHQEDKALSWVVSLVLSCYKGISLVGFCIILIGFGIQSGTIQVELVLQAVMQRSTLQWRGGKTAWVVVSQPSGMDS